mmetsp:Transcript_17103/g.29575  ORF Transcript_17103/g.29575 Transcript_17103/m.29575 type:complete len:97 (-) Transcript_17103:87-377(-)
MVLLHYGGDVGLVDAVKRRTPLHCAARAGCAEICLQLVLAKADPHIRDDGDGTPLMCARTHACLDVLATAKSRAESHSYSWNMDLALLDGGGGLAA